MGAVCCNPTQLNAVSEVKDQSVLDSSKLQAHGAEVLIPAKRPSKGKGKGKAKNAAAPKAPPQSSGKRPCAAGLGSKWRGCGASTDELATSSNTDVSTSKPCPICKAQGHIARTCPEKGKQKESSSASNANDMLVSLLKMYEDHGGDIDNLADSCKCSAEKLRRYPPVGADDFARNLVSGKYNIPTIRGTSNGWSASSGVGGA